MNLTLSLIFGMLWLTPGILALILWNQRGRRHGVRQPEQHLAALNGIALALGVSLAVHLAGSLLAELIVGALHEFGHKEIVSPYRTMAALLTRPVSGNNAREIAATEVADVPEFGAVLLTLSGFVWMMGRHRGLSLMLSGRDTHGLGWAFQHIIAPAEHGYVQVAHVLTSSIENGKGLGYSGGIVDIRLSDTGQVKAITLSPTERFVYTLGPKAEGSAPHSIGKTDDDAVSPVEAMEGFTIAEGKEYGGAVYLGEDQIANILVINYKEAELHAFADEMEGQWEGGVQPAGDAEPAREGDGDIAAAFMGRLTDWMFR